MRVARQPGSRFAMHTACGRQRWSMMVHWGWGGRRVHTCVMGSREMDAAGPAQRGRGGGAGREEDRAITSRADVWRANARG